MKWQPLTLARRWAPMLGRSLWALMALMHVPALVSAWRSCLTIDFELGGLAGCIGLTLALLFFALKVGGVSFLHFRPGRRAWLAIGLTVALIHVDCFRPAESDAVGAECITLFATTTLVGGLTLASEALRCVLRRRGPLHRPARSIGRSGLCAWLDALGPHCWVLARRLFLLRAPPV